MDVDEGDFNYVFSRSIIGQPVGFDKLEELEKGGAN